MNRRLWLLLIVHVIGVVGICVCEGNLLSMPWQLREFLFIPTLALTFCQLSLLAFWATIPHAALWKLFLRLCSVPIYLSLQLVTTKMPLTVLCIELAFATGLFTVVLLAVRWRKLEFRRMTGYPPHERRGLQFSIRGLMLITLITALLIASAIGLRNVAPNLDEHQRNIIYFLMLLVSFAVTGLASLWSTFGLYSPIARNIVVVFMPLMLGVVVSYSIESHWGFYSNIMSHSLLESVPLLGSLLVIRSCGYRLVRRDRNTVAAVSS